MNQLISGEEWRHVTPTDAADLVGVPPDAEVIAEAKRNIERTRRGELRLRLLDGAGRPRAGVELSVAQLRHEVVFGCSSGSTFAKCKASAAEAARAERFLTLFNGTHAKAYWNENWHQPIERTQGCRVTSEFEAETAWAVAHGLEVRGHPLVWTVPKALPAWLPGLPYERQLRHLENHVRSLVALGRGRIRTWDLCIEMLWEASLRNVSRRDWPHEESMDEIVGLLSQATRWAREEDPAAVYCVEDYGLETSFTWIKERHGRDVTAAGQRRRMVELARRLADAGAGPDAIATQAHCGKWFPMGAVWKTFRDLSQAGLDLQVSEFWAHDSDHPAPEGRSDQQIAQDKARYMRDYFTVAFGTPNVTQISCWGDEMFFAAGGWKTTPAFDELKRLIRQEWWTDGRVVTDADGEASLPVFYGDHRVSWHHEGGRTVSRDLRLSSKAKADRFTLTP
jgi:GH35 family endo-1,4-beta-xylanase